MILVQQIDVRLEQIMSLPPLYRALRENSHQEISRLAALRISFKNCSWLIANDSVFGFYLGSFLWQNSTILGNLLYSYTRDQKWLSVTLIQEILEWLDNWPVGLKLNTELSRFFYVCFMTFTNVWDTCLDIIAPYFPLIFKTMGIFGWFGLTMILSLGSDLLSLFTLHLHLAYLIATGIFAGQLNVAHSLWNLFRGKRYNALRKRTDSTNYDVDQLLVGTILLTLVAFTMPTVVVYYALFAIIRLLTILAHATSEAIVASLNHFPLFAIMLRLKEPSCLPGGVYFEVRKAKPGALFIRNLPIPVSRIFFQHFLLWSRLSSHYHPVRLLVRLVTGAPLTQISRNDIRYAMLPKLTKTE
ncbi:hypothetical protein M422DRAFT_190474 [Sphaerobolus stellatus SS14]|uniref:Gpi1-domain-containing protein n=1 Tax=Sphaerobolus stellatus (strain SS14) TaxID=990650 RepID=A0A0C9UR87_SPHS4|nr:hypothetical protein M422DRAFT_190474 [Sphaerobolus stellatus SS14]